MCAVPLTSSVAMVRCALASLVRVAIALCAASCGELPSQHARAEGERPLRIVSLSPALTECVIELGLGDRLVGRTPWCTAGDWDVPVVGTLLDIDAEALVRCAPTMILVQPPAQGIDRALADLAARNGWPVHEWRINGLDDARGAMSRLAEAVAEADPSLAAGARARDAAWSAMLDAALVPLPAGNGGEGASPVLVMMGGLEGISFGKGTYIDDALRRMGVRNALERSGYPALSVEDVARIAPRTVVVVGTKGGSEVPRPDSLSAAVIALPPDGLAVPGGRLPHGLMALREALRRAGDD